ncbi:heat-inducible transcriptional repressor HrcA [Frankia sp. CcI49]|uniref:Heat-inducible transcription repressor HrcA n=1 Tax=Parafrankia irregularis TaxID=795642 RepID=A0A0S4QF12_9ACTN|nr:MULTISPECIES: heat-inducible transcriptional repressor HrcA [Frankiaceae]EFC85890.1 heat-inducible transcription repressor HrcA [Parafrankia sp. EUN1f]KPM54901.1 HrcA family transcriptional regulator [Frankia sp. R43]MBE3199503.1 heat-inducible transcriptional repressor HrcA [Parafrankia sp. CH37]ONH61102.1 heat-inducible transcriptional repressor HrcA [Frankia sp. CcI49]CUU53833.1 heat-inducible transcriptional repressor [Parafrankia irregularis]
MLEERRLEVLRAIVEDFVLSNEPVGSKTLAERHALGVSPATVRNDMSALEEEGYITQPHTSAGRIPTDKGYRLFVDRLSGVKPLSRAERKAIQSFLEGAVDLDDVVRRSVRLLAQLTRQVAVVQYPSLSISSVRHIEIVTLNPNRLLLVLITDTGRVEQRVVDIPAPVDDGVVGELRGLLNGSLRGRRIADATEAAADLPDTVRPDLRPYLTTLTTVVLEALLERQEERVALAGTANLTRASVDFADSLRFILEALEEQVVLLKLIGSARETGTVTVRIGRETDVDALRSTSVVATGYGLGPAALGGMGVVGPMRMDYPGTMAAVRAVAKYVGELLGAD